MPNDLPDWTPPGRPILIDTALNVVPGSPVTHTGIKVPETTQTLMVVGTDQTFFAGGGHVDVTGETSNQTYFGSEVFETSPSTIPVEGALYFRYIPVDATVRAVYDATAAVSVDFWMFALPTPTAVTVINSLRAVLEDSIGDLVYAAAERTTDVLVGVSLSKANPAPWQAANKVPVEISSAIAAGANLTLVSAVNGTTVWLHDLTIMFDSVVTTAFIELQDSGGTGYHMTIASSLTPPPKSFHGAPLPVNLGARLHNAGSSTINVRGSFSYSTS